MLGLRPYNEIAIAIPLRLDGRSGPALLGAFAAGPDSGYYIACMPVTSDENRMRGHHFWNLPKISRRIDVAVAEGLCRFDSYGEKGELDISLSVPISGRRKGHGGALIWWGGGGEDTVLNRESCAVVSRHSLSKLSALAGSCAPRKPRGSLRRRPMALFASRPRALKKW